MLNKIKEYNDFFTLEHRQSFELIDGQGKIMISAPHSVAQIRRGKLKDAEPQTGVIAKLLHDDLDIPIIYKTKNMGDDANFDTNSDYKNALIEYIVNNKIKLLIDLHQLSPSRKEKIDICTGKLKNIDNPEIINVFFNEFLLADIDNIQIDKPFSGSLPTTIVTYVRNITGIQSLQIEINSNLLYERFPDYNFIAVYQSIKKAICTIERNLI